MCYISSRSVAGGCLNRMKLLLLVQMNLFLCRETICVEFSRKGKIHVLQLHIRLGKFETTSRFFCSSCLMLNLITWFYI